MSQHDEERGEKQLQLQDSRNTIETSPDGKVLELKDPNLPVKLMARIDMHVMPTLIAVYLASFLDRINFSNALIYGMTEELDMMRDNRVSIAISMLFVTYVTCELPATIVMKKTSPQLFIPVCAVCFGILMTLHGVVHNYASLVALRVLMGIFEAAIYPASFYLMSMWYTRREALKRFSFFTAGCSLAGAFGGLIAAGIGYMDGVGGYRPWRWIFILEGLFTVVIGLIAFFTVSDFPEKAKWLGDNERKLIVLRLSDDQGHSGHEKNVPFKELIQIFTNWKIFLSAPFYFGASFSVYALGYFIPTIISSFGYDPIQAQLHSVIPWAATLVFALAMAYLSDRYQIRAPFLFVSLALSLIGNIMLFTTHDNLKVQFGGLFLYLMGLGAAVPIFVCWISMNLRGHRERVVGIPYMVGVGGVSGIAAAFSFPEGAAPTYHVGYSLGLAFLLLSLVIGIVYTVGYMRINKKMDKEEKYML